MTDNKTMLLRAALATALFIVFMTVARLMRDDQWQELVALTIGSIVFFLVFYTGHRIYEARRRRLPRPQA